LIELHPGNVWTRYDRKIIDFTTGVCWPFCNASSLFYPRKRTFISVLTINQFVGAGEQRVRDSNAYCT
jgi:hypothetical protein